MSICFCGSCVRNSSDCDMYDLNAHVSIRKSKDMEVESIAPYST